MVRRAKERARESARNADERCSSDVVVAKHTVGAQTNGRHCFLPLLLLICACLPNPFTFTLEGGTCSCLHLAHEMTHIRAKGPVLQTTHTDLKWTQQDCICPPHRRVGSPATRVDQPSTAGCTHAYHDSGDITASSALRRIMLSAICFLGSRRPRCTRRNNVLPDLFSS